ncbi:MAG: response regulator [Alphaproteobacteria bacterium]|nr:response regulator [Alphaproteobacteria bacterium]MBV9371899.1 response regulator [Alphaproteobacteria bacterium]MBV9902285.1 response regulator [Alphaproteobacteria bacterium]
MPEGRLRVLVVEDEMLVAMNIEDMLLDLGHEVAGIASRLAPALALAEDAAIDAAMLDVNLAGESSFPVADVLLGRGIPFFFATGYGLQGIEEPYRQHPVLQKPFRAGDLRDALAALPPGSAPGA